MRTLIDTGNHPTLVFSSRARASVLLLFLVAVTGLFASATIARAQTRPASDSGATGETITEMSPFFVDASSDVGYKGEQSLLGSRFKQEIRDIPAQIEVFTTEFLRDFDLTRVEDAFKYSASVENAQEFISPNDGGGVAWNSQTNGRIRGLLPSSMSVSRELFSSITTADSYNLDRVELASGAQSLMFSLGEPAGMANMSLKRARMKDAGNIAMRIDTESGHRVSFDVNKVLYRGHAALRVAAVSENRPQFIKPSHDRNQRLYGALTLQPFRRTMIRMHAEHVWEDSNRPVTHLPFDWATPAYKAKQNGTLDSLPTENFGAFTNSPILISGGSPTPISYLHWRLQKTALGPQNQPFDPAHYGNAKDPNSGAARTTFNPDNIGYFPEVASMVGKNFFGDNLRNKLDSKIINLIAEQQITDTIRVEIGGHKETWDKRLAALMGYAQYGYHIDVDRYIPIVPNVTSTVAPDFNTSLPINQFYALNPNYGKLYARNGTSDNWTVRETEEYRGSIVWEPNPGRFSKWLGRHSLLASFSTRTTSNKSQSSGIKLANPTVKYQNLNSFVFAAATRVLILQQYVDTQQPTLALPFGNRMSFDSYFTGFTYTEPTTGEVLQFSDRDLPVAGPPTGSKSKIDSGILAWQGRFLKERVNLGYGRRSDDVKAYTLSTEQIDGQTYSKNLSGWYWMQRIPWNPVPRIAQKKTSQTYGGIVRPWRWLSMSYYESSTFSLATGNFTPFGVPTPGVEGKSKDLGVRFDLFRDRLFLKVNAYDVTQVGSTVGGSLPIHAHYAEQTYRVVTDAKSALFGTPGYSQLIAQEGFDNTTEVGLVNIGRYPMTGDTSSKGWEVTAGTRLGRLDVRLTGAKTDAKTGNVADTWSRWIAARLPFWQKLVDANGRTWDNIPYQGDLQSNYIIADPVTGQRRVMTMKEFYDNVVVVSLASAQAANGKPVDSARKYRTNLNLAYSFNEGRLRGFRVGGAAIYRSGPIVGFPVKPLPAPAQAFPIPILDFQRPYYGSSDFNVDAFVAYRGKNFLGSRKVWSVQINGSNLLTGTNSFRTGKVDANGKSIFTVIETPRAASATLDFEF